jgi:glycosyltransferase involved in cell wall biosynthesis
LALSDIFVLPSLAEGLPGALIEAMAAGLPCIASDIPGNRELVLDGQTGLTFRGGDAVALAEAILRLLSDGDLARSCGEAAWRWALEGYDQRQEEAAWRRMFFQLQCGQPVN